MTLPSSISDRERQAFTELPNGDVAKLVSIGGGAGLLSGISFDTVIPSTDTLQEIYTFKSGGVSGSVVATVTITYSDFIGGTIASVVRT